MFSEKKWSRLSQKILFWSKKNFGQKCLVKFFFLLQNLWSECLLKKNDCSWKHFKKRNFGKNFSQKKFFGEKIFGKKKSLVKKQFWWQKIFGQQKFSVNKIIWLKNVWSQKKNLFQKKFSIKINLVQKFWFKTVSGPKRLLVKKMIRVIPGGRVGEPPSPAENSRD